MKNPNFYLRFMAPIHKWISIFSMIKWWLIGDMWWLVFGDVVAHWLCSRLLRQWSRVRIRHLSQRKLREQAEYTVNTVKSWGREGNLPWGKKMARIPKLLRIFSQHVLHENTRPGGGWGWTLSLEDEGGSRLASVSFSPASLILSLLSLLSILLYGDVNASARALLLGQIFNGWPGHSVLTL